jgi:hypothetical protein
LKPKDQGKASRRFFNSISSNSLSAFCLRAQTTKKIKKVVLKSSVVILTLLGTYFTSPSYAGEELAGKTLHICPGNGENARQR